MSINNFYRFKEKHIAFKNTDIIKLFHKDDFFEHLVPKKNKYKSWKYYRNKQYKYNENNIYCSL